MIYNPHPPYEILQNKLIDFATMQKLRRFARYWDLVGNSGNFIETTPLIWNEGGLAGNSSSPFHSFMRWSDWLHARTGRSDGFALAGLMELLFEFLTGELKRDPHRIAAALWRDYQRGGRRDQPPFLKQFLRAPAPGSPAAAHQSSLPKRQARHLV
jgi:hypothetical protein